MITNPTFIHPPLQERRRPDLSVGIVPLQSFTLLAFAAFVDTLRLAADEGDQSRQVNCSWTIVGSTLKPVKASCGAEVMPWEPLGDPRRFKYIVVVGGLLGRGSHADPATIAWLRRAAAAGVTLIGMCVGTFTLLRAGLMTGRRCCISAYHAHDFAEEFPNVTPITDQWFVVDRDRITCPGGVAAADVAAYLIKRHCGEAWARKSLQLSLIDEPRPQNHPQPLATPAKPVEHTRLRKAIALIELHLNRPPHLKELADKANLSPRQLQRLFKQEFGVGPHVFSRNVRLRYGRWLLGRTERTVSDIADACGFRDVAHFCRQFRAFFKMSPLQARAADRAQPATALEDLPWRPEGAVHTLRLSA
ncbi:MAG TPA: GlxA family transcriptional regulator [Azospirillaceae bacterium]|nr:GlxA family transcriptional regulator [Azospirillaceae bacterium]